MDHITDADFKEKTGKGYAIVDFWAEWCGPCKAFGPVFEDTAKEFPNVTFAKMDVDAASTTPQELGIRSIPTIVFFKDGQEIDRVTGAMSPEDFKTKVKEVTQ